MTIWLPNGIGEAKFPNGREKRLIEESITRYQSSNGKKVFQLRAILEAAPHLQVWLLCLNSTDLVVIPSGIVTTFSATLVVAGFGYKPKRAALVNMSSGMVSVFPTLLGTHAILHKFPRWLAITLLLVLVPTLLEPGLMSFYSGSQAGAVA